MLEGAGEGAPANPGRARMALAIGALVGLALATIGILEPAPSSASWPEGAVAIVDGVVIREAALDRALLALARDSKDPVDAADREHVLGRLIDEELLVQRATALGLDRTDPVVRNTLVSAMIETIVSGVGQSEPSEAEVRAFYDENRDFFARTDRYWVRQLRFPVKPGQDDDGARARAEEGRARLLAGEPWTLVARELDGAPIAPVPDGFLPVQKLREYLGPTPAARAVAMQTGEVSEPIRAGSAWHVLQMVERVQQEPLPLAAVESQVRAEMRRRAGDDSLRGYLRDLRDAAHVELPGS